jgi:hypothetical protein
VKTLRPASTWRDRWPTVASTFRALPDPADHPTFAIAANNQRNEGPTK